MHSRRFSSAALLAVALLISACAPEAGAPTESPTLGTTPSPRPVEVEPVPTPTNGPGGVVPDEVLAAILADAEDRTDVARDEMEVLRAEAVTWNDGSLGCPQEGMMYTQALVDGYHVELRAGDRILDYRSDQRGSFILCENGLGGKPAS